jgi:hypothetical protein
MSTAASVPTIRTLLVTSRTEVSPEIARAFTALRGVEVERCTVEVALERIEALPDLALLVVDSDVGESEGAAFVSELRTVDPTLRIIWLGQPMALGRFGTFPPDRILPDLSANALEAAIRDLLRFDVYSPPIVQALHDCTVGALEGAFNSPVSSARECFKANQLMFAATAAIVPFSGPKLSGWCLVTGDDAALAGIRARTLEEAGEASRPQLEDVAGELANHIFGYMKAWFIRQGVRLSHGAPLLLYGPECRLRERGGCLAVVVRPEIGEGTLWVQLSFNLGSGVELDAPEERVKITSGAFKLLS